MVFKLATTLVTRAQLKMNPRAQRLLSATPPAAARPFPSEIQLLLGLGRLALDGGDPTGIVYPTSADGWQAFSGEVARQRIGPFLLERLAGPVLTAWPATLVSRLRRSYAITSQHAARQLAELVRLQSAFSAAQLPLISLKGPLLSLHVHGAIDRRHGTDLDLLVPAADVPRADALLQRQGYRRTRPDFDLTPRQEREYFRAHYEFEYVSIASGLRVELVWRLEGLPAGADHWTQPPRIALDGHVFSVLRPEANFVYLCSHGARHGWNRLFWLLDIALLFRRGDLDSGELLKLARAGGSERAVWQASHLARELFATPLPAVLATAISEHERIVARLGGEACRQIALPPGHDEGTREWFRQLVYRLRLQTSLRARCALLRPHVFSLASWKAVRLPDRWFALYHVLTPFLWLSRKLGRRARPAAVIVTARPRPS